MKLSFPAQQYFQQANQQIRVKNFLKKENPKLYKEFTKPYKKPLLYLIQCILREEAIIHCYKGLSAQQCQPYAFLEKLLRIDFHPKLIVQGEEHLPHFNSKKNAAKKLTFVANHPLGAIEAIALLYILAKRYPSIKFLTNRLLSTLPIISEYFVNVGVFKRTNKSEALQVDAIYAANPAIILFPAGSVAKKDAANVLREKEWKKNFLDKSLQHKRDIIPIFIKAENSAFFYRLARFRRTLKIKSNLEMFLLPRELLNFQKDLPIQFTQPIVYPKLTKYLSQQMGDPISAKLNLVKRIQSFTESHGQKPLPKELFR